MVRGERLSPLPYVKAGVAGALTLLVYGWLVQLNAVIFLETPAAVLLPSLYKILFMLGMGVLMGLVYSFTLAGIHKIPAWTRISTFYFAFFLLTSWDSKAATESSWWLALLGVFFAAYVFWWVLEKPERMTLAYWKK